MELCRTLKFFFSLHIHQRTLTDLLIFKNVQMGATLNRYGCSSRDSNSVINKRDTGGMKFLPHVHKNSNVMEINKRKWHENKFLDIFKKKIQIAVSYAWDAFWGSSKVWGLGSYWNQVDRAHFLEFILILTLSSLIVNCWYDLKCQKYEVLSKALE